MREIWLFSITEVMYLKTIWKFQQEPLYCFGGGDCNGSTGDGDPEIVSL